MSVFTRRLGAFVASSALAASGLAAFAAPAGAVVPTPEVIGADWLAGQLVNGLQQSPFGGPDVGLSIDTASALQAVGGHAADISAISDAIGPQLVKTGSGNFGYAESDEYTFDPSGPGTFIQKGYYASGLAKSLYFAETFGVSNIPTWAGADIKSDLENLVATTGPSTGRVEDNSSFGDFASVLSQAYAASALVQAGSPKQVSVLAFLLQQQCSAGYFRLNFTPDKSATDQSCDGGRASGQSPADPDVTAEVTRLLLPFAASDVNLSRRVGKAEAWLLAQQHADGSFGGGITTSAPNANSTGLAGWTLGLLGDSEAAGNAAVWVRQHQADELAGCSSHLITQTGAIAYNNSALANGRAVGITPSSLGQWVRASSQALPVLHWAPTGTSAVAVTGPSGYVEAGKKATYHVSGVVPGHTVCVTGLGIAVVGSAGIDGTAAVAVTIPPGTATRTISATDGTTSSAVQTKSLGAAILRVKPASAKVRRGHTVRVTVSGLASGEKVTVRLRGHVVASGTATSTGTFTRSIHVGRTLGKATLAASGQFADLRHGSTSIRVIR